MTPIRRTLGAAVAAAALVLAPGAPAAAVPATENAWTSVTTQYEAVRVALVNDRIDGVAAAARAIQSAAAELAKQPTAAAAGVPEAKLADVRALLPEVEKAATALATAANVAAAREAFYALSKPLVRWREAAGRGPAVAFCSMAQRSWLQPEGEIGNPYYGQSMARCGEIVSR